LESGVVVIVLCVYITVCGWIPIDVFRFKCVAISIIYFTELPSVNMFP
jgi:hypothetical protein